MERGSPRRKRTSSVSLHRSPDRSPPASQPPGKRHSPTARRASGRSRIAGFDDEEDLPGEEADRSRTVSQGGMSGEDGPEGQELDEEHCAVCLSPIENKTVVHPCHHGQFCWNCIRAWTDQSRKCPLCLGPIEHLIHNIRSTKDYQIHHLLPLSALASDGPLPPRAGRRSTIHPALPRHALYGRNRHSSASRLNDLDETTWREREEERALERRKYIYKEGLYAKHVASNRYTGFKPFTPQTFANNADMKARVIKFVRRELQVFPTVDISFLTTYLVSIASQLDLRSAAAIRLISDFLSEQDAQHLVHEITTFARSPFTSLEGYDRFVQYGRPEREIPREQELEEYVHDEDEMERQAPRFAEHMHQQERRRRREDEDGFIHRRPPPAPPMASLPPRPTEEVRRGSQDEMFRRREGDRRYGEGPPLRRGRSPSPGPPAYRRGGPPPRGGRYRSPSPPPAEPSWRDRDERRLSSPARSSCHSPAPLSSRTRGRSRSVTPVRRSSASPTPPPLPHEPGPGDLEYEMADAISLGGAPSISNGPTPRAASPAPASGPASRPPSAASARSGRASLPPTGPRVRPTLSIFGAARKVLGNGNVVTFGENGRATRIATGAGVQVKGRGSISAKGKEKSVEVEVDPPLSRDEEQEPYDAVPASLRPAGPAGQALLARLGQIAPSPVPSAASSESSEQPAAAAQTVTVAASSTAAQSLREKLQARLTAEYRTALASKANGAASSTSTANGALIGKTDLRALLQSRLQAEKALASRSSNNPVSASASFAARGQPAAYDSPSRATFSQATRDLLMARLEEERLLAMAQASVGSHLQVVSYGDEREDDPLPAPAAPSAPTAPFTPSRPSSSSSPSTPSAPANSESSLKAALLAKRQAVVEDELKKRTGELKEKLMRQKLERARREREAAKGAAVVAGGE
ncbi:hypothetical protein JCM11251_003579 [Rhodosporidiobolus azoricus]